MSDGPVLLVGLDCVPPAFAFDRMADLMPCLSALRMTGLFGHLRSCEPPITVPAWACMLSAQDPGEVGLYGFRQRVPGTYDLRVARSHDVRVKRIWDLVGESGRRAAALFVPPSAPPPPLRGLSVGCFLTGRGERWAFPASAEADLLRAAGPHRPDVIAFDPGAPSAFLDDLESSTRARFTLARHVLREERPACFAMVEIGPDRLHHALFAQLDPSHPLHDPGSPLVERARAYYALLDQELERLIDEAGPDASVIVASDHGARRLEGGVCVNEWLARNGWLVLEHAPERAIALADAKVDWEHTKAWAEGGYYARVFLNVRDREPRGCVSPGDYELERERLAHALASIPGPAGKMDVLVRKPEEVYGVVRGDPPDLMVYFDDLARRAIGTVGHGTLHLEGDDRRADGCNHDWEGIVVAAGARIPALGRIPTAEIYDVGRTMMHLLGVDPPPGARGRSLLREPPGSFRP